MSSPKRLFLVGSIDHFGVARPHRVLHCTGFCRGGRAPCNCTTGRAECEMDCEIAPDDKRVIQPPPPIELDPSWRARINRRAVLLAALGFAVLAGLLKLAGAQAFNEASK